MQALPTRSASILCDVEQGNDSNTETVETLSGEHQRSRDLLGGAPVYGLSIPARQTGRVISALAGLVRKTPNDPARPLYCLDGGNAFNPYRLTTWMRRRGYAPTPWLDNIFVSRAYTCHQLVSSAETLLAPLLAKTADTPLVALLGIDQLFLDEDLAMWERRFLFGRLMNLVAQYRAEGLPMLITFGTQRPNPWARQIAKVARVLPGPGDGEPDRLGESLEKIEAAFSGTGAGGSAGTEINAVARTGGTNTARQAEKLRRPEPSMNQARSSSLNPQSPCPAGRQILNPIHA